jgi:glycosyltransferase involved in cell wall biosynthesis
MKTFVLAPGENWIVDRFVDEWKANNSDITTSNMKDADVIWIVPDWCWTQIPQTILQEKKVLTSIHHIVPEKFCQEQKFDFIKRHHITDAYHVPCNATALQVDQYVKELSLDIKPIFVRPFWINEKLWQPTEKQTIRKNMNLEDAFWVGSFQRDTEGNDLKSPKKEKGPDIFCDAMCWLKEENFSPKVLLSAWRREYVRTRLEQSKISFRFYELVQISEMKAMYAACDLYVVGSRYEGGPQAIFECAAMKVPIVSTNVGAASEILHPNSIFDASSKQSFLRAVDFSKTEKAINRAYLAVQEHFLDTSFTYFRKLLESML